MTFEGTSGDLKIALGRIYLKIQQSVTRLGEQHNIEGLVYNPLVTYGYARAARRSAPIVAESIRARWPDVKTCIDCGCGLGHYVEALRSYGVAIIGVEYSQRYRRRCARKGLDVSAWDLTRPSPIPGGPDRFDLALSIEVAEHVPATYAEAFVEYVGGASDRVLLTAAPPGQGGTGHVNEQPKSYWIERFATRNFLYAEEETAWFAETWTRNGAMGYLGRNAMVFRRVATK